MGARLKVRLARLALEAKERARREELEFQLKCNKLDAETAIKIRQIELQSQQEAINQPRSSQSASNSLAFDVCSNIALVPPFRETEVEAYFSAFECIATALQWPKEAWPLLLQCRLVGKAQEACAALSIEDSLSYTQVKQAILRTYELVPEAYRQRFHSLKEAPSQTFVEFAKEKVMLFDRWCVASKATDFSSLRELILLEEFRNCVPEQIMVYLNEQKATTLQEAAVLAEEFTLTHKSVFVGKREMASYDNSPRNSNPPFQRSQGAFAKPKSEKQCFYFHHTGHLIADCLTLKCKRKPQPGTRARGVSDYVVNNHITNSVKDDLVESHPDVFRVSVLKSQRRRRKGGNLAPAKDKLPLDHRDSAPETPEMADVSLDKEIKQRGGYCKAPAQRPTFGPGAEGGKSLDARQKFRANEVRRRRGAGDVQGTRQMTNSRKQVGPVSVPVPTTRRELRRFLSLVGALVLAAPDFTKPVKMEHE